jgi:proteasome accessory factor B
MADTTLERLTNLHVLLRETSEPLTLEDIADRLPAYRDEQGAVRRALFERDKSALAEAGVRLDKVVLQGPRAGATAYRLDAATSELPELELSGDERRALALALGAVRLASDASAAADKLGAPGVTAGAGPLVVSLPEPEGLPAVQQALAHRSTLSVDYGGKPRVLRPYGVVLRDGFWYLVAAEDGTEQPWKVFRVDRFERVPEVGPPGEVEVPAGFRAADALPRDFKAVGDGEPVEALVLVEAIRAARVVHDLGDDAVVERRAGGAVVVRVPATNLPVFRGWLLGMLDHAEVLEPPEVRAHVRDWLAAMAGAGS